jgi:hypothetical protein
MYSGRLVTLPLKQVLPVLVLLAGSSAMGWEQELDLRQVRKLPDESQATDYYTLGRDARGLFVHALYRPGNMAIKRGFEVPPEHSHEHHRLRWRWRALVLPVGGDECDADKRDSAGSVYVLWRRGLRTYGLKYSWSTVGKLGAICDRWNNPIIKGETVILETGGPRTWVDESLDLDEEFRKHFEDGDPQAKVPRLIGIAILTDGDQTQTPSSADFGSFVLSSVP